MIGKLSSPMLKKAALAAVMTLTLTTMNGASLQAIEIVRGSAVQIDNQNIKHDFVLPSYKPNFSHRDSCLPLLKQVRQNGNPSSPLNAQNDGRSVHHTKASMPVTLGFLIGVRVALGPKEIVKSKQRVQIAPEIYSEISQRYDTGARYALAIADYRACKSKSALNNN